MRPLTSLWCIYGELRTDFTHYSGVPTVDVKQINVGEGGFLVAISSSVGIIPDILERS